MLTLLCLKVCLLEVILNILDCFNIPHKAISRPRRPLIIENASIGSQKADMADLWVFVELYTYPN